MADIANQLLRALKSLGESTQFCVSGSVDTVLPGLEVDGVGPVGVPITATAAKQLIGQASQAPYGRGEETVVDTGVRRVWQLEPKQFTLRNSFWRALVERIIEQVRDEFGIKGKVDAHLYKLLVYEKGSFFVPHRDTEKVDGMFATLVVCLPSKHDGGTLLVQHEGQTKEIEFGGKQGEYQVQYAAFYADCRHEIKPVTKGYRVCLVYNLALAKRKHQPEAPRQAGMVDQVAGLLVRLFEDEKRNKVVIPLEHEYTRAGLKFNTLKGADRGRVALLRQAAERLGYQLYLALMDFHQVGGADYSSAEYSDWDDEPDEDSVEMVDVFEEELTLSHWVAPVGRKPEFDTMDLDPDEIVSETPFEDFPFRQEFSEATGNEGATVERWYHRAVVVFWPADRYFRILAREGQGIAIPALAKRMGRRKSVAGDAECRAFAEEIIGQWQLPAYHMPGPDTSALMLELLDRLEDPGLIDRFLRDIFPKDYRGTEGLPLAAIAERQGWETVAKALTAFVTGQQPDVRTASLPATASIVENICTAPGSMTPERKQVCQSLARELERIVHHWDDSKKPMTRWNERPEREGIIPAVVRALAAVDEGDRLHEFLDHVLADTAHYPLHEVLIPAVRNLTIGKSQEPALSSFREKLRQHCVAELERLTATPPEEPPDWAQDVNLHCTCRDCQELQRFLRDPNEKVLRLPMGKERRRHLHSQIEIHHCDLTHETEHVGSPQTLVCTKTRASYDRKKAEHAVNVRLLKELRGESRVKRTK